MSMSPPPPRHRAAFGGESVQLVSGDVTLALYRRTTGWGWGELRGSEGTVLAVLDHLGELKVRDSVVPMRLEADRVEHSYSADGSDALRFSVRSMTTRDALAPSSFASWVGSPFDGPLLTGIVEIAAVGDTGSFDLSWQLISEADMYAEYVRGPWVRVGATSFGARREDAILPGIEWALDAEWSSGDDWFRDPWGMRVTPPVDSVAIPTMAVSHHGSAVSLSWTADADAASWFTMQRHRAQPVFASPNFVERNDSSLLGLMVPETSGPGDQWSASVPLELHRGQHILLSATLAVTSGTSLDAVLARVCRKGLPVPTITDGQLESTLHRIANAFATNLWHEGRGFGVGQVDGDITPKPPGFTLEYLRRYRSEPTAVRLAELVAEAGELGAPASRVDAVTAAETLLSAQEEDGSFRFDPEGRHRSKDDFVVARDLVAPMGLAGESALDMSVLPVLTLLRAFIESGDERFAAAARAALDSAASLRRPEGGDFWETPLHSPNLLAAGHGAIAYGWAWKLFGRDEDRNRARYWLRSLLVFTHLWEPKSRPMLYNTKPCLCSSDWYFANWVRDHVQWEVIDTVALAAECGVDLTALDDELDWIQYFRGVTSAGARWLLDHRDDTWRPHNIPTSLDRYRDGGFDGCLPDTHNSTTGLYGGMAISPSRLAEAILAILPQPTS